MTVFERTNVSLKVDEVTLMEDRARIVRRGQIELAAGVHRLAIANVAPVLVDKTLRGELSGGQVHDVSVHRSGVHRAVDRSDETRALDLELERADRDMKARTISERRNTRTLELIAQSAARAIGEISDEAAWTEEPPEPAEWHRRLDALAERESAVLSEKLALSAEASEHVHKTALLRARREAIATPSDREDATLHIDVNVEKAGSHELSIQYVVPNACWRPYHRATLANDTLRFESEACIWQNTGEEWSDAELRMSTQRPSLGAEPPKLATDRLAVQRKSDKIQVEAREETIETTGLGRQIQRVPELPGIDDGGEVLDLVAEHRATIPSDGRPHRVPMFAFESDATTELFCAPELTGAVLTKTMQANASKRPILAGPVDLARNGGFVGRTSVLYIAPDERFELGWGPDAALRVHRTTENLDPEKNLLRNWTSVTTKVVDKLSNLGPEKRTISLVERVAVSELEKVQIEVDEKKTSQKKSPDHDGFLRWSIELAPFGREEVELWYTVRRHSDVVGL